MVLFIDGVCGQFRYRGEGILPQIFKEYVKALPEGNLEAYKGLSWGTRDSNLESGMSLLCEKDCS